METVGFIGIGKIGLPICENLIKSGYRAVGFRRSSLADFEKIGGMPAKSPAEIGEQANFVFSCVPSSEAVHEVIISRRWQERRRLPRRRGYRDARDGRRAQSESISPATLAPRKRSNLR